MTRTESLQKNVKGRASKVISRKIAGRNAACLGFAQVTESGESKERYGDVIFPPAAAAGIPTLVTLTENDTNGTAGMLPITGLVVEAIDVEGIAKGDDGKIAINMAEVKEVKISGAQSALTGDEFEFQWSLCVHGLHVDANKDLHAGPKILVPAGMTNNVSAYGIATDNGVERALSHAIKGEKIDLLMLWTAFKLVQGAQGLAYASLAPEQKKAAAGALRQPGRHEHPELLLGGRRRGRLRRAQRGSDHVSSDNNNDNNNNGNDHNDHSRTHHCTRSVVIAVARVTY